MASITKRPQKDGSSSYQVVIRLKGHPRQYATFKRKTDAKRWAQETESAIRNNRYFPGAEARNNTLAEAIDRYERTVLSQKRPKTASVQQYQLNWWRQEYGDYSLLEMSSARISDARERLATGGPKERSPATVKRYLMVLSHLFTIATKEWGWVESNPVTNVMKPKEPKGRVRYLKEDERDRLLEACAESRSPHLYPAVVIALWTGMRRGEILGLRWEDVDFERSRVTLHDTKNADRRVVPMVGPALDALMKHRTLRSGPRDLVFPAQSDPRQPADIRNAWESAVKRAELENFRFHDLRHTAASYLAMSGASLAEIAEVLGHKTLSMVKRYAHLSEGHTASVMERMVGKFA